MNEQEQIKALSEITESMSLTNAQLCKRLLAIDDVVISEYLSPEQKITEIKRILNPQLK